MNQIYAKGQVLVGDSQGMTYIIQVGFPYSVSKSSNKNCSVAFKSDLAINTSLSHFQRSLSNLRIATLEEILLFKEKIEESFKVIWKNNEWISIPKYNIGDIGVFSDVDNIHYSISKLEDMDAYADYPYRSTLGWYKNFKLLSEFKTIEELENYIKSC